MDTLDILEQKVLSAVTKINQIEAERAEIRKQLDARSAEVESLGLEKKQLLGEVERLKKLKNENERLRESIDVARKRIEKIISKIDAAGLGDAAETPGATVEETVSDSESIFDGR